MKDKDWKWVEFVPQSDPFWAGLRSSLVGFVAINPISGNCQNLGAGFLLGVVHVTDENNITSDFIVAVTAKHVLQTAYQSQTVSSRSYNTSSILFEEQVSLDHDKLRAVWMGDTDADFMVIRHVCFANNLDIGICILETQPHSKNLLDKLRFLSLDTRVPSVGTTVHIVSLTDYKLEGSSKGKGSILKLGNRCFVRKAQVISHEEGSLGHAGLNFRLNCPTSGGMSGGFVYVPGKDGESIGAAGIISSSKETNSILDFTVPGSTAIAPILGILGLELPFVLPSGKMQKVFDLVSSGYLRDITRNPETFKIIEYESGAIALSVTE